MTRRYRLTGTLCLSALIAVLTACGGDSPTGDGGDGGTTLPPNTITPNGGTLEFAGGDVTLVVLPGAVSENLTVTVQATTTFPSAPTAVGGTVYDLGPDGTQFDQSVQLALAYDPARLPAAAAISQLPM